jgi:hypothetical protein
VQDKDLPVFGRAALLRRPRDQGRAAALPYQKGEDDCLAPNEARRVFNFELRRWQIILRHYET